MAKQTRGKSREKHQALTVRLDAEPSEVNAAAVGSSMTALVALVTEAKEQMAEDHELLVKARPFSPGSFEIPIDLILVSAGLLFENSPLLEALLDVIRQYFEVKVAIEGSEATSNDGVTIQIHGHDVTVGSVAVTLLRPTSRTEAAISDAFATLEQDSTIKGFEILRPEVEEPIVKVRRRDFRHFVKQEAIVTTPTERIVPQRATVTVRAVKFEGNAKWEFNWRGRVMTAKVLDPLFIARVQAGEERFAAGDRLKVELRIHQRYEAATRDYLDKAYEITKVWEHQPRNSQREMFE